MRAGIAVRENGSVYTHMYVASESQYVSSACLHQNCCLACVAHVGTAMRMAPVGLAHRIGLALARPLVHRIASGWGLLDACDTYEP